MTPTPWLRELARLLVAAQLAIPSPGKHGPTMPSKDQRRTRSRRAGR